MFRRALDRQGWFAFLVGCWLFTAAGSARAQMLEQSELEAGFLLNFLRFTTWADSLFASPEAPVVVSVIGDHLVAGDLAALAATEHLGPERRPIVVQARSGIDATRSGYGRPGGSATAEDIRRSHLVFIGPGDYENTGWILRHVRGRPTLTVGNQPDFAREGGMLELRVRNGRMTFDASADEIEAAGVSISSKVLRLARAVDGETP